MNTKIINNKFEFNRVVFFGRRLEEYVNMFDLDVAELTNGMTILDCAAGPAAFAKQAADAGIKVVACDPMYELEAEHLRQYVDNDSRVVAEKQAKTPEFFHEELVSTSERRQDMEVFLADFANGKTAGRYVSGRLPELPFADRAFDMILLGNLLFLYSDPASGGMMENSPFDYEFHSRAIAEMIRVCRKEVRIYPLQGPNVSGHQYLAPIVEECKRNGHTATIESVRQLDIIGAEKMLRITRSLQN